MKRFFAWTLPLFVLASASVEAVAQALSPPDRAPAANNQTAPDLASNGSQFMAMWIDGRAGFGIIPPYDQTSTSDLYATRLDAEGRAIDELGILVATSAKSGAVAARGNQFVAAFSTDRGAFFTRIDDGVVTGQPQFLGLGDVIDLETDGTSYCVLLKDSGLAAVFVDQFGALEKVLALPSGTQRIVSGPEGYWVVGTDFDWVVSVNWIVSVRRFSPSGVGPPMILGETGALTAYPVTSIIRGGDHMLVGWLGEKNGPDLTTDYVILDQHGARVTNTIRVDDPRDVPSDSSDNRLSLGWDGREFLLGWSGYASRYSPSLRGFRVRTDGTAVDSSPEYLTPGNASEFAAAHEHGVTLIVIPEDGDLVSQRGASFASMEGRRLIAFSSSYQSEPRLAAIGSTALASWTETRGAQPQILAGALITDGGGSTKPVVISEGGSQGYPINSAIGASRQQFLALWGGRTIQARRIAVDGQPLDIVPLQLQTGFNFIDFQQLDVASDGTNFLAVWDEVYGAIRGTLIRQDGTFNGVAPLTFPQRDVHKHSSQATWTGSMYLILWGEWGSYTSFVTRINLARVTAEGVPLDTSANRTLVSELSTSESYSMALATSPAGRTLVVWVQSACVRGLTLSADGVPINGPRTIVCGLGEYHNGRLDNLSATWNGKDFTVLWSSGKDRSSSLRFVTVNESIDVTNPEQVLVPSGTNARNPALTFWSRGVLSVFEQIAESKTYGGVRRIFGRNVRPGAAPERRRTVRH